MGQHTLATLLGALLAKIRGASSMLWRLESRIKGVEFQGSCEFQGRPLISVAQGARLVLGPDVRIYSATRANPLGLSQPSVLRAMTPGAELILGRDVGLSGSVLCAGLSIHIGEGTILGAGAMVLDNDFHAPVAEWGWKDEHKTNALPIRIGRGVFVGARAIILKGVTVGDRAIIGAGAVVTRDVPAGHVAVGNPTRVFPPDVPSGASPQGKKQSLPPTA